MWLQVLGLQAGLWLLAALAADPRVPADARHTLSPSPAPASEPAAVATTNPAAPGSLTFTAPAVPKPAPARRQDLAAAFTKPVPTSIADLRAIEQRVKTLVSQVSPAVVAVEVGFGSGSGVVISADGLVLSAGHVCGRPNRDVRFTFPDGKTARGKTVGVEHEADTGLMRITDPGPWPHVAVGDFQEARPGDWVLALGHPGGFDLKRSLVVRLGRIIQAVPGRVQSDCTISPGDSGGPLFDMHGRVVGIHSAISSSLAANFHVPITKFFDTWDALASGQTEREVKLQTPPDGK